MTTETSIFDRPTQISDDVRQKWLEKGWSGELLEKALNLRIESGAFDFWVNTERMTQENVEKHLQCRETLMFGTLRAREATWQDNEALAEMYADSPEEIGDWEVTVERGPYPFAQFRLQEHVAITVLEDRGVILAATCDSGRNTLVGGEKTTVHIASAWRVRKAARGKGYSHLLRTIGGPACGWFGWYNYYTIRGQNFGAMGWIKAFLKEAVTDMPEREGDVPGLSVTVHHFEPRSSDPAPGIRAATERDLDACIRLINRTHKGADLFRPYTRDFLEQRLHDPSWGPKPPFWTAVYGWPDYYVVEDQGRVVACGGLWDKGANVREVWRHKANGEERTIDSTALMDFGYAAGREDAMVRLLEFFAGKTKEAGRSHLVAGIEHLPRLVKASARLEPGGETRALHWQRYDPEPDMWVADDRLTRPYMDIAYW
jgi:hypothetical protein